MQERIAFRTATLEGSARTNNFPKFYARPFIPGAQTVGLRIPPAIRLIINSTRNTKNKIFAIPAAPAAIPLKPNNAATRATMKKRNAQYNIEFTPCSNQSITKNEDTYQGVPRGQAAALYHRVTDPANNTGRCLRPGKVRKPGVPRHYGTLGGLTHLIFVAADGKLSFC